MDDGVVLRGDLERPVGADGKPVAKRLPVLVTITAYNKTVLASGGGTGRYRAIFMRRDAPGETPADLAATPDEEPIPF